MMSASTHATKSLRDAVSGDLTGLEARARRLADRIGSDSARVSEAYVDAGATRTNHVARLRRLRDQLDAAATTLDEARDAR